MTRPEICKKLITQEHKTTLPDYLPNLLPPTQAVLSRTPHLLFSDRLEELLEQFWQRLSSLK